MLWAGCEPQQPFDLVLVQLLPTCARFLFCVLFCFLILVWAPASADFYPVCWTSVTYLRSLETFFFSRSRYFVKFGIAVLLCWTSLRQGGLSVLCVWFSNSLGMRAHKHTSSPSLISIPLPLSWRVLQLQIRCAKNISLEQSKLFRRWTVCIK